MKRVALITCRVLPEPDFDEDLLLKALAHAGVDAEMLAWDDGGDPGAYDLCVLRSCWNYFEQPDAFLDWIARADRATVLSNDISVLRWNLHKRYLLELEAAGVPVIPTAWVDRGSEIDLQELMTARGWDHVVVKPAVSAGSFQTQQFRIDTVVQAQSFLNTLVRERDAMVQRFMSAVETSGERALVWIDGELTHAVRKLPRFADGVEQVSEAIPISVAERAVADRALSCVKGDLLYGRVDVVDDDNGNPVVSELELLEPSLFLLQYPPALERFVAAIARPQTVPRRGG